MVSYLPRLYKLTPWLIRMIIPSQLIGTYTLYLNDSLGCRPVYTGRSDTDLRRRLISHPLMGYATHFEYNTYDCPEKAFIVECAQYHLSKGIYLNKIHPAIPNGSLISCPFCKIHGRYNLQDAFIQLSKKN